MAGRCSSYSTASTVQLAGIFLTYRLLQNAKHCSWSCCSSEGSNSFCVPKPRSTCQSHWLGQQEGIQFLLQCRKIKDSVLLFHWKGSSSAKRHPACEHQMIQTREEQFQTEKKLMSQNICNFTVRNFHWERKWDSVLQHSGKWSNHCLPGSFPERSVDFQLWPKMVSQSGARQPYKVRILTSTKNRNTAISHLVRSFYTRIPYSQKMWTLPTDCTGYLLCPTWDSEFQKAERSLKLCC